MVGTKNLKLPNLHSPCVSLLVSARIIGVYSPQPKPPTLLGPRYRQHPKSSKRTTDRKTAYTKSKFRNGTVHMTVFDPDSDRTVAAQGLALFWFFSPAVRPPRARCAVSYAKDNVKVPAPMNGAMSTSNRLLFRSFSLLHANDPRQEERERETKKQRKKRKEKRHASEEGKVNDQSRSH